jgi:antitoxin HicB
MSNYPAKFAPDADGGFVVTFRDIPEAITQADTLKEAREAARDALITAMDFYVEDRRVVPQPSKAKKGEELVELPPSVAAKVLLLNTMIEGRTRPVDLARAMRTKPQEVNRLMDLHHTTKIDTLADAFKAMGRSLELVVR